MAKKNLTEGNITKQLMKLTWPMLLASMGIVMFNLVDTYFVGKLGVEQLAAMSFTFPFIMVFNSFAQGVGIGTSSLVSRNFIGSSHTQMKQMTTRAILLGIVIVLISLFIAWMVMEPVFRLMGAEGKVLEYVMQYMRVWILGMPFVVIPMIGNNIIRATGDTLTPGMNILMNGVVNAILDPLFIFGIGFFPEMGMAGAAMATVIGRATGLLLILYILLKREKLLTWHVGKIRAIFKIWEEIIGIAIPTSLTMLIPPISMALITRILSSYGEETMAAFGVASRIEMFGMLVVVSLGSVLIIFVGQNMSQNRYDRIRKALRTSFKFSLLWGVVFFILLLLGEGAIASLFTTNNQVVDITQTYFYIVGISYGMQGILSLCSSTFNGLDKPMMSALMSFFRMVILYLPLAWIGSKLIGRNGVFIAGCIANVSAGLVAVHYLRNMIKKLSKRNAV
ncbi:MAG: MATE family efflux transporter [Mangrovibacterium sp.]